MKKSVKQDLKFEIVENDIILLEKYANDNEDNE